MHTLVTPDNFFRHCFDASGITAEHASSSLWSSSKGFLCHLNQWLQQNLFYPPGLSLPSRCMVKVPTTSTVYDVILRVRQPSFSDNSQKAPAAATQQFPTIWPADISADISADIPHITVTISETKMANMYKTIKWRHRTFSPFKKWHDETLLQPICTLNVYSVILKW